jgi:hypothetical protein
MFWSLAVAKLPSPWSAPDPNTRPALAFTFGFGLADLVWSVPFLLAGCIGLLRLRPWGWLGAQAANVLYWYSSMVILFRDAAMRSVSPGTVTFLPFAVFAAWAAHHLWRHRSLFSLSASLP